MDFEPSQRGQDYLSRVRSFIDDHILPMEAAYHQRVASAEDPWVVWPEIEDLKARARSEGLWNLFLPDASVGAGLSVLEYAPLAEAMGRSAIAPEVFNCNAPDTGNMEVFHHFGSTEQKARWLAPLLRGEIRSAFCMTEPEVASSDATNMQATIAQDGSDLVLRGRKWWSTGIGHPRCEVLIFMGLSDPQAHRYQQHSMVAVPRDAPGVRVERMLPAMGRLDAPYGHGEVVFDDVRVSKDAVIGGLGMGFLIAQGRLGPGRIHHCMRLIGLAEWALELAVRRAGRRTAFGKPIVNLGGNRERIAHARIRIDQARLLVLKTAWMIDRVGVMEARSEISQIKVVCPQLAQDVIDLAMQLHGGAGLSDDVPLSMAWTAARALRLADGPDEVHLNLVAREELKKYRPPRGEP